MIVLIYTRGDEVAGDKALQWVVRGWDVFILNVLFLNFCIYIKISMKRDIFWDRVWDNCICLC